MASDTREAVVAALAEKYRDEGDLQPEDGIHKRVLSMHRHWLSEEEAATDTVSFSCFTSMQEYRFYLNEEAKFVDFFACLFRNGEVYHLDEPSNLVLLESWQQLIGAATLGLREQQPFLLYVRRFQLLLASAYDLNVAVYFLDPSQQDPFAELASAYQLHLLPC